MPETQSSPAVMLALIGGVLLGMGICCVGGVLVFAVGALMWSDHDELAPSYAPVAVPAQPYPSTRYYPAPADATIPPALEPAKEVEDPVKEAIEPEAEVEELSGGDD